MHHALRAGEQGGNNPGDFFYRTPFLSLRPTPSAAAPDALYAQAVPDQSAAFYLADDCSIAL